MSRVNAVGSATPSTLTTKGDGGSAEEQDEQDQGGKKKKKKKVERRATGPGFGNAGDKMERRRPTGPRAQPMGATMGAGLAVDDEGQGDPSRQIAILKKKLEEAESGFEFMGTGHPSYERTRAEVAQLRAMIKTLTG